MVTYSVTMIYSQETIFKWLRNFLDIYPFKCPTCLSVWIGAGLSFLFPAIFNVYFDPFVYGMISYFTVRFGLIITNKNEFRIDD